MDYYIWGYLCVINLMTFLVYGLDKWKAKNHKYRISEKTLIGLAVIWGSIGAWIGMQVFRHKTKHPKFVIGVPVIFVIQIGIVLAMLILKVDIF